VCCFTCKRIYVLTLEPESHSLQPVRYIYDDALIREGAHSAIHSLPEINLNINFKAQNHLNRKTKTDTNLIPDPNRYRRPDPIARIRKFCTHSKEGAQSAMHSLPEINLNINFKAQNRETKTDTNPIPDPN